MITRVETTMRGARHSRHSRARACACMRVRIPEGTPKQRVRPRRGSRAFRLIPRDRAAKREDDGDEFLEEGWLGASII